MANTPFNNYLDSQMYQTVGTSAAEYIAKAMDLPLFVGNISGTGNSTGRDYLPTEVSSSGLHLDVHHLNKLM